MNNKGFAVSGIIYSILILFLILIFSILSIMGARKMILDKLKNDVMNELNDIGDSEGGDVALVGEPIIEKAKELVYENGICKTDGSTYQYMGGCYIKGNPNNNYVWYSGFLWRIMGINSDRTVKLITDENVTSFSWGESGTAQNWDGSYAKNWLNNYFYPRLKGNNIISEQIWCSDLTTNNSSTRTTCANNLSKEKARVGLMAIDEYNLAGGKNSYLNIGQYQWSITPYSNNDVWGVFSGGTSYDYRGVYDTFGLRAVINVNFDSIITGGNGVIGTTWSNESGPYVLNEDKNIEVTGKLNEKSTSGEYVEFVGKKYRVVDKDSDGNTKLILDGYYEEIEGSKYTMSYGSNNTFTVSSGIGQKLNTDILNWIINNDNNEKNKLVINYSWYQNEYEAGKNYLISLNETNPTRIINTTVGLIRVGEMLSGQSSSILTDGYTSTSNLNNAINYWTNTPYTNSSNVWTINEGIVGSSIVSSTFGVRPVIVVNSDVTITGGNGTWSSPYKI